jgi:hypothetical protein
VEARAEYCDYWSLRMVASDKIETDELIYSVIRKHVTDTQIRLILEDLISMPGNKPFRDTVGRLMELEKKYDKNRG